jgi:hypothetical protein
MMRWTRSGWDTCLGAGIDVSWWEDRGGRDFWYEAHARNACGGSDTSAAAAYAQQVLRLEWMGLWKRENASHVRRQSRPDPNSVWYSLALLQRRRLASLATHQLSHPIASEQGSIDNKIAALLRKQPVSECEAMFVDHETGAIVIPAARYTASSKVTVLSSFSGGQQLLVKEDGNIQYDVPMALLPTNAAHYHLTCRVATAHRSEQPLSLTVTAGESSVTSATIPLPYTMGLWGETEPVQVAMDGTAGMIQLRLSRPHQQFGFALKEVRLTPVKV